MTNPVSGYFDINKWIFNNFETGGPPLNLKGVDEWISSYAAQAQKQGLQQVTLLAGQVCNLSDLIQSPNGQSMKGNDDAFEILNHDYKVPSDSKTGVFEYVVQRFEQYGLKVKLSFGGALAQPSDWNFGFSSNLTPEQLAQQVATWAQHLGISGFEFNLPTGEAATSMLQQNGAAPTATFFASLHTALDSEGMTSSLTVPGNINDWGMEMSTQGQNFLWPLFQSRSFTSMFDDLTLNLFDPSSGKYYLNAGQKDKNGNTSPYDITSWIQEILDTCGGRARDIAPRIHVGFDDGINYLDPSSSGGPLPYTPPIPAGFSNGQAAAWIYQQLLAKVQQTFQDPNLSLGTPSFQNDKANYAVASNDYESFFFQNTSFDQDFTTYQPILSWNELLSQIDALKTQYQKNPKMKPIADDIDTWMHNLHSQGAPLSAAAYLMYFISQGLCNGAKVQGLDLSAFENAVGDYKGSPFYHNPAPKDLGTALQFVAPYLTASRSKNLGIVAQQLQTGTTLAELYQEWTTPPKNKLGEATWLVPFLSRFNF